jgi:predicted dithiol-disulfide oxidoreductase (DUF899 family)
MSVDHKVVSQAQWIEDSKKFLVREKEFTKERDALSAARRELPWVKVSKDYQFEGENGIVPFASLFGKQSQLIVYHFMYDDDWQNPCEGCSFMADNFDGIPIHLKHRDVAFVAVAKASYAKLKAAKERMGWSFDFYSSSPSDFNVDHWVGFPDPDAAEVFYNFKTQPYGMDQLPGASVFYKDDDGTIYRTYSTYARGLDMLIGAYHYIDLVPKGRDAGGPHDTMQWVMRHDEYED